MVEHTLFDHVVRPQQHRGTTKHRSGRNRVRHEATERPDAPWSNPLTRSRVAPQRAAGHLLHDRDGALAHERDRDRVGTHALARDAAGGVGGIEEGKWVVEDKRSSHDRCTVRQSPTNAIEIEVV